MSGFLPVELLQKKSPCVFHGRKSKFHVSVFQLWLVYLIGALTDCVDQLLNHQINTFNTRLLYLHNLLLHNRLKGHVWSEQTGPASETSQISSHSTDKTPGRSLIIHIWAYHPWIWSYIRSEEQKRMCEGRSRSCILDLNILNQQMNE